MNYLLLSSTGTHPLPITTSPTMDTTYTIHSTSAAGRATKWLHDSLWATIPTSERSSTKIIHNILDWSRGHFMYPQKTDQYRYIHVVIDVQKGKLRTAEEKQELLQRTVDACLKYEGRHAEECEVEVRINEVEVGDCMRVRGRLCR